MAAMAPGAMPTKDEEAIKVSKTINLMSICVSVFYQYICHILTI